MTVIPELQHELVRAARHRHSRAARAWRIARPVLLVAACAAVVAAIILLAGHHTPVDDRPAPARPAPAPSYSVLQRPAGASDALPDDAGLAREFGIDGDVFDTAGARLAAQDGPVRVFLVPASMDDAQASCTLVVTDDHARYGGCAVYDRPVATWLGPGVPKLFVHGVHAFAFPGGVVAVVPDGIDAANVRFADGSRARVAVRNNVALHTTRGRTPRALEWASPDGVEYEADVQPERASPLP